MTCPAEWRLGVYVDDELDPVTLRQVEGHLVGCEACRRRVLELQSEARLLADVLADRPLPPETTVITSSARGLAAGLPASLGVLGLVLAVATFLFENRVPSGMEWLRPVRWLGVNEMILDLIFALRDQAPGVVDFAAAIAVTASVAALITFLANLLIRRALGTASLGLALVAALLAMAQPGRAEVDLRFDEAVHVAADETIESTLIVTGDSLILDGTVKGNVVAFSERVIVRGVIEGELVMAGRELELSGVVKGNVHGFGEQLRIEGRVDGSVYGGFDRITITSDAEIGRDLAVVTGRLVHEGRVGRDLSTGAALAELRGSVGRHLEFWGEKVEARTGGAVGGDFTAHVGDAEDVSLDEGYQVAGATDVRIGDRLPHMMSHYGDPAFYLWRVVWLAAAFAVGLLLYTLAPWLFAGGLDTGVDFIRALGFGFAFLILGPVVLVLVALTVVGVPLAVIGAGAYCMVWYLAAIAVAALVGRAVTRLASDSLRDFGLALLAGLVLLTIAYHLPWIGGLLHFLGLLLGFGLLFERGRAAWEGRGAAAH